MNNALSAASPNLENSNLIWGIDVLESADMTKTILVASDSRIIIDTLAPLLKEHHVIWYDGKLPQKSIDVLVTVMAKERLDCCHLQNELPRNDDVALDSCVRLGDGGGRGDEVELANIPRFVIRLSKPFSVTLLIAQIEEFCNKPGMFCTIKDGVIYDELASEVRHHSEIIKLTEKENWFIKAILVSSLSKDEILHDVWGYKLDTETSTIDTHLSKLRAKLLPCGISLVVQDGCVKLCTV